MQSLNFHKIDHATDVFQAFPNTFLKYTLVEQACVPSYLS